MIVEKAFKAVVTDAGVDVSDGYHTFDELYEHRFLLYCALLTELARSRHCWKSKTHWIGAKLEPVWAGWFAAGTTLNGKQISYHLPLRFWDLIPSIQAVERAPEFDGHTSADVLARIEEWLR